LACSDGHSRSIYFNYWAKDGVSVNHRRVDTAAYKQSKTIETYFSWGSGAYSLLGPLAMPITYAEYRRIFVSKYSSAIIFIAFYVKIHAFLGPCRANFWVDGRRCKIADCSKFLRNHNCPDSNSWALSRYPGTLAVVLWHHDVLHLFYVDFWPMTLFTFETSTWYMAKLCECVETDRHRHDWKQTTDTYVNWFAVVLCMPSTRLRGLWLCFYVFCSTLPGTLQLCRPDSRAGEVYQRRQV